MGRWVRLTSLREVAQLPHGEQEEETGGGDQGGEYPEGAPGSRTPPASTSEPHRSPGQDQWPEF